MASQMVGMNRMNAKRRMRRDGRVRLDGRVVRRKSQSSSRGLILLVVLGMLGLFTLLAVTYVVAAGNSRQGARAQIGRAVASNSEAPGIAYDVLKQVLRGTRDQNSAFYFHDLLGDIYGRNTTSASFGHSTMNAAPERASWCTNVANGLVKVSLDPRDPQNPGSGQFILNPYENAYNSRLITVLTGPLSGQTFRILKYVGYVRPKTTGNIALADPNFYPDPTAGTYEDASAYDYDFDRPIGT
jgi:hypothetical protein